MLLPFDTGSVCFPCVALPLVKVVLLITLEVGFFIALKVVSFVVASGPLPLLSWPSPVCALLDSEAASALVLVALIVIAIFAVLENLESPFPPFNPSTKGQPAGLERRRGPLMTSKKLDLLGILPPSFAEQLHMSMNTKIEYKTTNPTLAMVFRGPSCSHEVPYRSFREVFFIFHNDKG